MATPRNVLRSVGKVFKLVSVEPYLFLILFAYDVRMVTFQNFLMDTSCRNLHLYPDEICNDLDKHKSHQDNSIETGNNIYSFIMLASSLPAIIVAIFLGPWSDKYSRKYPLLISAFGQLLEASASAALAFFPAVSPVWFVVVSVLAGFSGGFIMSCSAAFSYMSDVTDERSRPARYAVLEFSNIFALLLGNILGGQIYDAAGYIPVMVLAPCSFAAAIVYTAVVVKETKPKVEGQTCSGMLRDLVTIDNIKQSYKTCSMKRPGNIRLQIWLLVWTSCSQRFCDLGILAIAYPFTRGMYKWNVTDFSHASTAHYVVCAFAMIAIVPVLANNLRLHEAALGLIGMLSLTAKMVITSVAFREPLFYYAWMCGALNNAAGIAIRSRLSKLVNKDELGRAFSLLATCESVTPLLGTLAFVQIYNSSFNLFPGLAFACAAVFLVPSIVIFGWMMHLPTISLGDYARDDRTPEESLENRFSSGYDTLNEEKF